MEIFMVVAFSFILLLLGVFAFIVLVNIFQAILSGNKSLLSVILSIVFLGFLFGSDDDCDV